MLFLFNKQTKTHNIQKTSTRVRKGKQHFMKPNTSTAKLMNRQKG